MTFERYAENLLTDFNTRKLDENVDIYTYTPKYFDITEIFLSHDIYDDDENFHFDIKDARNLISIILDDSWDNITNANKHKKEIYELKLGSYKINSQYDINNFDTATFWIESTERDNNIILDDEEKLKLYKYYLFENKDIPNEDIDDLSFESIPKKSNQTTVEYFRQQAKLLLKDYKLMWKNNFDASKIDFDEPQEHFDVTNVLAKANKSQNNKLTLMNAQHILAKICDFKNWDDFLHSSKAKQKIGALKLNCYKIGMDPDMVASAEMLVEHELFVDFAGNENYTDDDELAMWEHVMRRLLF